MIFDSGKAGEADPRKLNHVMYRRFAEAFLKWLASQDKNKHLVR
jgi:hypothetical protein